MKIASTAEIANPALIPWRIPIRSRSRPPRGGATTIGIRFTIACAVNPTIRLPLGSSSPIIANVAGSPSEAHARTSSNPTNTPAMDG